MRAAEAAGVQRFVFVSLVGLSDALVARAPFAAAKRQTEQLLAASAMRSVIVRPAAFQEVWLAADTGIDPKKHRAVIFGQGRSPVNYIAVDDVAEARVRLALADDPPAAVELGGPESLTRREVVDAFERAYGVRFRRIAVPRPVMALGARAMRRLIPRMASVMGMALSMDVDGCPIDPGPVRALGIEPRTMTAAIAAMPGARTSSAQVRPRESQLGGVVRLGVGPAWDHVMAIDTGDLAPDASGPAACRWGAGVRLRGARMTPPRPVAE